MTPQTRKGIQGAHRRPAIDQENDCRGTRGDLSSKYSDFSAKIPKIGIFIAEISIVRWEFISNAPGALGGIHAANTGTPCELGIRFRDGGFVDFGRGPPDFGKSRFSKIPINWPSAPALRIFEFAAALPRPRATASRTTTYQTFPIQDESYRQVLRRA